LSNLVASKRRVLGALVVLLAVTAYGIAPAGPAPRDDSDEEGHFLDSEADEFAADADAEPFAGPAPLTVRFTARTINSKHPVTYTWKFDDGTGSHDQNPTHTFRKRGWYLVTMDARDAAGRTYRINLQLHAWRPRDWERFQATRDMRIAEHAARELQRKRQRTTAAPAPPGP
jgi:hypothetical protein